MRVVAWVVLIALQIMWLPVSIVGAVLVGYRQVQVSRRLGVSQTAIEVINGRATMEAFGVGTHPASAHPASAQLARVLPNTSTLGLYLALVPLRVAGFVAGQPILYPLTDPGERVAATNLVPWRTAVFDRLLDQHVDATQCVVLGAGLDTRAYDRFARASVAVWEVDTAPNSAFKRAQVDRAGLDREHVETDFADDSWPESLRLAGFDSTKKTVWILEGVTLYLSRDEVVDTLRLAGSLSGPGSVILMDLYSAQFVEMGQRPWSARMLALTGEQIRFGVDFRTDPEAPVRELVGDAGLSLGQVDFLVPDRDGGALFAVVECVTGTAP
jgi:methyltransferase (TIGR00027 family)